MHCRPMLLFWICIQCMLAVSTENKIKFTFHSMQHELEDALISCNGQVENLEKEIEEQRRYYQ